MILDFPRATKRYSIDANGVYVCPECEHRLVKIRHFYSQVEMDKDLYTLQCPKNREHCFRKTNVTALEASNYYDIPYIERCQKCNAVLSYICDDTNSKIYLICPNNEAHQQKILTSKEEIIKIGYEPIDSITLKDDNQF